MKSSKRGKSISAEITNISSHGLWILVNNDEFFLSYKDYPWFKKAPLEEVFNLKLLHGYHLYWPKLDIDLELDSIKNPKSYPLQYIHD